jgi:hypothetical protein
VIAPSMQTVAVPLDPPSEDVQRIEWRNMMLWFITNVSRHGLCPVISSWIVSDPPDR